jgi:predicted Zn-dependent protease
MSGNRSRRALLAVLAAALLVVLPPAAMAQDKISLIRDAETEDLIRTFSRPLFDAAGLQAEAVDIYLVRDDRLNAFTAGGMNLFLNTGFLMRAEDLNQMLGVIAHEIGHIAGGHLSRVGGAQRRAAAEMILATVLGAAAAVAGAPGLGTAIITGGQSYAQSGILSFSRSQEQAADQAAISYLNQARISARGLAQFFKILDNQNVLATSSQSPYLRTHPLTRDRILFVENQVASERDLPEVPPAWTAAHRRMVVKLDAFLNDPRRALERYRGAALPDRYARAIAHYRVPDLPRALDEIDALIRDWPDDAYFHELKGQMLFENGRIRDAIEPYRTAVELRPNSALLRVGLAQALLESGADGAEQAAIGHLEEATGQEPTNPMAWRLLGIAQGRAGREGASALSLAEFALLTGKKDDARLYARRAETRIEPSDPNWLRLQDVLRVLEES